MARVWAESKVTKAAELLVLLAIADFADDAGHAYPSIGTLATKCRITRRYAQEILGALQAQSELEVLVGKGPWGANAYRVLVVGAKPSSSPPTLPGSSPSPPPQEPGSVPPMSPAAHQVGGGQHGGEEAGSTQTIKRTITQTPVNHQKSRAGAPRDLATEFPEFLKDVDPQVLRDWEVLRKQKRAPISRTALGAIGIEADIAGMSMGEALAMCCARGWQGFRADWALAARAGNSGSPLAGSASQQYRAGRMAEAVSRQDRRTATLDGLTGRSRERINDAAGHQGAIDVDARRIA